MPVIKSAIKKLRQDKKSEKANDAIRSALSKAVKLAKKTQTTEAVSHAFSLADKAAKKHLIHANKAGRIKSSLSKPNVNSVAPIAKKVSAKAKATKKALLMIKKSKPTASKKAK